MLTKGYMVIGALVVLLYGWAAVTGREWPSTERSRIIPVGVRQSPGGYRSYHTWHSGYRGGK